MMFEEVMIQQRVVMSEVISVNILKISGGVGGAAAPPHDARRSDDSTKGDDDRRSDDSAKGA